jgi:1-acyl-sn-glycerol-3-phosphate acyltransferase
VIRRNIYRWGRAFYRLLVLITTSAEAGFHFLLLRLRGPVGTASRTAWLHRWCRLVLQRLSIEVSSTGKFPARGLLVSNHLSYLDVLVFGSIAPCVFIAKREVRSWPLYGPLARMAGTVFVKRERSSDSRQAIAAIMQALSAPSVVVLFPEGTSSDGTAVLPFRSALFEAAIKSSEPVISAHISYSVEAGSVPRDVCYWGTMTFLPHLWRLMSLARVRAQVRFATAQRFHSRKTAANTTRGMVLVLAGTSSANAISQTLMADRSPA